MSINGDVLVKIAAGLKVPVPVPKDILENDFPGLGAGPIIDYPYDDPRIKNIPRIDRPVNTPKGEPERTSRAGDIGRAAGRAARTVRDGAVDTAREVGRSVSDAVRGFGQGWRGGR